MHSWTSSDGRRPPMKRFCRMGNTSVDLPPTSFCRVGAIRCRDARCMQKFLTEANGRKRSSHSLSAMFSSKQSSKYRSSMMERSPTAERGGKDEVQICARYESCSSVEIVVGIPTSSTPVPDVCDESLTRTVLLPKVIRAFLGVSKLGVRPMNSTWSRCGGSK